MKDKKIQEQPEKQLVQSRTKGERKADQPGRGEVRSREEEQTYRKRKEQEHESEHHQ